MTTTLDGTSFRAIGFAEPLAISVYKSKPDFPTRVDWDGFFHDAKHMNENEPGERPDTIYMSGLPFDWFQNSPNGDIENVFRHIFSEYGEISYIDIPQCDPYRKQMDQDISGIQLSSWSYGEDLFFEVYIQFTEYSSFVAAMASICGRIMVRKGPNGELNEARIKVDFDKTAHLSIRKINQRSLRRACIDYENDQKMMIELTRKNKLNEMIEVEKQRRETEEQEKFSRRLLRLEKRRVHEQQKGYERMLRKKLENNMVEKLKKIKSERKRGAKAILAYVAKLYREEQRQKRGAPTIHEMASEYVRQKGLPSEEMLRKRMIEKTELKMRTRMVGRIVSKNVQEERRSRRRH